LGTIKFFSFTASSANKVVVVVIFGASKLKTAASLWQLKFP
jgi:hypothetical protein